MRSSVLSTLLLLGLSISCGGDGPAEPDPDPEGDLPTLNSVVPNRAEVGSATLSLRAQGTDFVEGSMIRWEAEERPTVFEASSTLATEIPASHLEVQGTFAITVVSPDGEPAMNERAFQVVAPEPTLTSLSRTETPANEPFVLELEGDGFYYGSTVMLGPTSVPTDFVDRTHLLATLSPEHVSEVGSVEVSVLNAEPGGGRSASVDLTIFPATPSLAYLSSEGATAGRPGFDLHVFGAGFRPATQVYWNGDSRPTSYLSHEHVVATIDALDVAAPGTHEITLENPAPSGPAPGSLVLTVRAAPSPVITDLIEVEIPANDVAYSASTNLLYVSIGSSGGALGNTVAAIDPATGSVVGSVFVGSEPTSMAVSPDGELLWVALDGAAAVRPVDLPSLTAGASFALSTGFVEELEVAPGTRRTLAVSEENGGGSSPRFRGVVIYDDGVPRPEIGRDPSNTIAFDRSGDVLYGHNNASTAFFVAALNVDVNGLHLGDSNGDLVNTFDERIGFANGRLYVTSGEVIDARSLTLVGNLPGVGEAVRVDAPLGRAFILDGDAIEAVDINTFQSLGEITFARTAFSDALRPQRQNLIRWGTDGLAFRDGTKLYVLRTPLAEE